ncbi:MAG: hypothetical protein ACK5QX_03015, partial [bacterium]
MHAMINHSITTLSESHPQRWDEYLKQTVFALRVRTHSVTKFSPFYLLYGVEPRLPGDTDPPRETMAPLDQLEIIEARNEFTARTLEELGQDRAAAYHRSLSQSQQMLKNSDYSEETPRHFFKVNDMVKLRHHDKKKFEFQWKGPYYIVHLGPSPTYYLMDPRGRRLEAPVNQRELAPWLAPTSDNVEYFFDDSSRLDNEATPVPRFALPSSPARPSRIRLGPDGRLFLVGGTPSEEENSVIHPSLVNDGSPTPDVS